MNMLACAAGAVMLGREASQDQQGAFVVANTEVPAGVDKLEDALARHTAGDKVVIRRIAVGSVAPTLSGRTLSMC
jgi:hypothetical protein